MAAGFTLSLYPWTYNAQYQNDGSWKEEYVEKPHKSPAEEAGLGEADHRAVMRERNSFPELPMINYTSQYGMGCFEGLKAFPQKDGSLKMFRPDLNARRFRESMEGLRMPGFPEDMFLEAVRKVVRLNEELGFRPAYDPAWEADNFLHATSIYLRPFSWTEGGIGLNLSSNPYAVVVATPVGSYFDPDASSKAVTTDTVRATDGGTGWIKCNANYVIPTLAKKQAIAEGYMEAIFLDYKERKYIEEGSSCNIFFLLKSGALVTPALEKRVLNGVNRRSVMQLAKDMGVKVEERRISIEEAMDDGTECFVTGTAAGVSFIESVTHQGKTAEYNGGKMGDFTRTMLHTLKGIQYGAEPDKHGWMFEV
jgi:branched-chain amino acid aminotransferase